MTYKVAAFENGYVGGKESSGVYQKIINEIRPFDLMITGFLGHCAVSRYINHSSPIIGIDLDSAVIAAWNDMSWDWIKVINGEFMNLVPSLIDATPAGTKIVLYLDPPYKMSSIKSDIPPYKFTMPDHWHENFLSMIAKISDSSDIDILISHYPDPLYYERLSYWRVVEYYTGTRRGPVKELLFMNYHHTDGKLHDYQYLGDNKDERYNLKSRMIKNLVSKLEKMECRKRQAVLHSLNSAIINRKW